MVNNQQILSDLKKILITNLPEKIDRIILFGSQVQGKNREYSDYDILVVLKVDYDWKLEGYIIDLCYEIDLKYNIITDIKIISLRELNGERGKQTYINEALKNGISA